MFRLCTVGGLSLVLAATIARADDAQSASLPQFRGPNRDDVSKDTGLLKDWPKEGPPLAWAWGGLGRGGHSSVSLADGKLYTMGDKNGSAFIHALDATGGKLLWSAKVGKAGGGAGGSSSTPTVSGDLVFALGQHGDLVCVEVAAGKERWRHNLADEFKGSRGGGGECGRSPRG